MRKIVVTLLLIGLLLASCASPRYRSTRTSRFRTPDAATRGPTDAPTATQPPVTETPVLSPTVTPSPTPDLTVVGLPAEQPGTVALDFVAEACQAQWFTRIQQLPCPGDESQAANGYVMQLDPAAQGLPSALEVLLTYPPEQTVTTISSKYPSFTVRKGDRFRAVLDCRAHSACDVVFSLDFYTASGQGSVTQWRHLFTDKPVVVDYPLDALAGQTVQFSLAVHSEGNAGDGYAVWIAPHIYRPPS